MVQFSGAGSEQLSKLCVSRGRQGKNQSVAEGSDENPRGRLSQKLMDQTLDQPHPLQKTQRMGHPDFLVG
jgi:hypothetical protein